MLQIRERLSPVLGGESKAAYSMVGAWILLYICLDMLSHLCE